MTHNRILLLLSTSLLVATTSMLWKYLAISTTYFAMEASPTTINHAIVVGSGLAGLSAASTLIARGIHVHMLERASKPGGNSMKASSGINGAPTKYQPGPALTDQSFYEDTVRSAGAVMAKSRTQREMLIQTLTRESSSAIRWLAEEKGVDLSVVAQLGGHSFARTHRGTGQTPPGAAIVGTLLKALKESERFHLQKECLVTKVLKVGDVVEGVEYCCGNKEEKKVLNGPVVFASGGFAGDANGMLAKYRPDLEGFPSTNEPRPGSQGLLTDVGAQLLDMEQVQIHPTSFVDPKDLSNPVKFLAAEMLRGEGGILLHDGKRFVNEMETRKIVTDAITLLPVAEVEPRQWDVTIVLDEGVYEHAKSHVGFYLWKGLMRKITISELGSPHTIASIQQYADAAHGKTTDILGRRTFGNWKLENVHPDSVVYVGRVTPAVHFTMGGVVISENSEVLDQKARPIQGLWAAGEVTGGIHGENRLGGSSLLECVVFGRRAGAGLADYLGL